MALLSRAPIMRPSVLLSVGISVAATLSATAKAPPAVSPMLPAVNGATFHPLPDPPGKKPDPAIIRAEVLLDRARFSPGPIDGLDGDNFRKAVGAYQARWSLPASGRLDQATWDKLVHDDAAPALVTRTLTTGDLKGPFVRRIPRSMEAQSRLERMGYRDVQEEIAEQYHVAPGLLAAFNPGAGWHHAGTPLVVPQVVVDRPHIDVKRIVVDKTAHAVEAFAADGTLAAFYPASIGSAEKPAPSGNFTVRRVVHNPDYTYNPKYAFKGVRSKTAFTIAPGPNNPVGSVWLDLSYEGYGIHGTPDPSAVGKTQSHGCIRLTNWTIEDLASMVSKNAEVDFQDGPSAPADAAKPSPAPASPGNAAPPQP